MTGRHAAWLAGVAALWFSGLFALHALVLTPMAGGLQSPDHPGAQGFDHLSAWLGALDTGERAAFLTWHTRFADLVFPVLLAAALYAVLRATMQKLPRFARLSGWAKVLIPALFVIACPVFDLWENTVVAGLLNGAQSLTLEQATFLATLTALKYAAIALAALMIVGFWLAGLKQAATRP